ncbi:MAG: hypothetical protein ACI4N0_04045 [Christensenellales bacterium]
MRNINADVIWEPEYSFYKRHREQCFHDNRRRTGGSGGADSGRADKEKEVS